METDFQRFLDPLHIFQLLNFSPICVYCGCRVQPPSDATTLGQFFLNRETFY